MTRTQRDAAVDWERRTDLLFQAIPYILLPLATLLFLLTSRAGPTDRLQIFGIAVGVLVWTYLNYTRPPGRWAASGIVRPYVYFAGVLVFAYVLMSRDSLFFIYTITAFIHAFLLKPPLASFPAIAATSILINTVPSGGWPRSPAAWTGVLVLVVIQTLAIGSFAFMGTKMSEQHLARRATVIELEAALAENAALQEQLVARARETGAVDERQRLAREIHDTLAQNLIGIITQLEAADEAADDRPRHDRHLSNAARLARDALAEARRSVHALGPQSLENRTLPDAMRDVASAWSQLSSVPVEIITTGDVAALHPEVEGTLIRTAQEALANVGRHANASRVTLTLSYMGDVVTLDVRDDGVGFEPDRTPPADSNDHQPAGGFGLTAMRQRIARVAGSLVIESEPSRGTAISARVPAIPLVGTDA